MAIQTTILTLEEETLPDLYHRANESAIASKKWHVFLVRSELSLVVVAAFTQLISRPFGDALAEALHLQIGDVNVLAFSFSAPMVTSAVASAIIPGIFIALAIAATVLRYVLRLDERWHAQRALAEAVRSLAWQYCMRTLPGDLEDPTRRVGAGDAEYFAQLSSLADTASELPPPSSDGTQEGSSWEIMQALRNNVDLTKRRDAYVKGRLKDQRKYYTDRAELYHTRRNRLRWTMVLCYIAGGLLLPFNGLGAMTTTAGALGSWLTGQQYEELYQSYGTMASNLGGLINLATSFQLSEPDAGQKWASFVNGVENLFQGERHDWKRHADHHNS